MKKVDQVLKNGCIVSDYDVKLSTSQIADVMKDLFGSEMEREGKQFLVFKRVGILCANVTYLGHPHPEYKKRIQLKDYFPDYVATNESKGRKTAYLGIYTYERTQLFVVFEPSTYAAKKSHNSSAHIFSMNLQYAQRTGEFTKVDGFGNVVHVFKRNHFIKYVKKIAGLEEPPNGYADIVKNICDYLNNFAKEIPLEWNGLSAYKEMVDGNFKDARQNRWPGWYFEFLFQNYLNAHPLDWIKWNSDKKKGGIDLDLVFPKHEWVYGDAKADQADGDILGNSFDAFDKVVQEHNGVVYYICALYKAEKDSNHGYVVSKYWNSLRDEDKAYTDIEELKRRAGRAMKFSVKMKSICVLKIDRTTYDILKETPFKQGVNSDGAQRPPKLKIKRDMAAALSIYEYRF